MHFFSFSEWVEAEDTYALSELNPGAGLNPSRKGGFNPFISIFDWCLFRSRPRKSQYFGFFRASLEFSCFGEYFDILLDMFYLQFDQVGPEG